MEWETGAEWNSLLLSLSLMDHRSGSASEELSALLSLDDGAIRVRVCARVGARTRAAPSRRGRWLMREKAMTWGLAEMWWW